MTQTRRDFLKKAGCGLSMAALASSVEFFGHMDALAQKSLGGASAFPDYKALVCIFLNGGNDGNNTIVPTHDDASLSNYATYRNVRAAASLALPRSPVDGAGPYLLPMTVPRIGNLQYGMHPSLSPEVADSGQMPGLIGIWNTGKLAVMCNVGNLVSPLTRTTYQNNTVPKPYQLFSHSDQIAQQQSSRGDAHSNTGWAGRVADKLRPQDNDALIPMITSIAGVQLFTSGVSTVPIAIGTGPLDTQLVLGGYDNSPASLARKASYNEIRTNNQSSNVIKAANDITDLALSAGAALNTNPTFATPFPQTQIGTQLLQVARIISMRNSLSANRQIFFVQLPGFDTHNAQLGVQADLLMQLSQAMRAFYNCTLEMAISTQVTTFTLSDFGRTFQPAAAGPADVGSDHGWGNHAFIMGGSVNGGNFYGMNSSNGTPYPTLALSGPDDTDNRGRWIPTTSVEQYAAVLASWYGVDAVDLSGPTGVFPLLGNFTYPSSQLSFL